MERVIKVVVGYDQEESNFFFINGYSSESEGVELTTPSTFEDEIGIADVINFIYYIPYKGNYKGVNKGEYIDHTIIQKIFENYRKDVKDSSTKVDKEIDPKTEKEYDKLTVVTMNFKLKTIVRKKRDGDVQHNESSE